MHEKFKRLREEKGLSVKALAEKSGVHEKILSDIEDGQDFDIEVLIVLCRFYHVKICEIFLKRE